MLTLEEMKTILAGGRELRNFEVKGPGPRADHLQAKVIRACLGMGNLRDGGYVLIGLDDGALAEMQPGLSDEDAATWTNLDEVARKLAEYSDPSLVIDIGEFTLGSGAKTVLIEVSEFADVPHICSRQSGEVLKKGALYVRSRAPMQTVVVDDPIEMREIIDLATEKALRRFVAAAQGAGVELSTDAPDEPFDDQLRRSFE